MNKKKNEKELDIKNCKGCGKEIKFKEGYEVEYGNIDMKDGDFWLAKSLSSILLCKECYAKFKFFIVEKRWDSRIHVLKSKNINSNKQCRGCQKEIKFKKCYEIENGKISGKDNKNDEWIANTRRSILLCQKCYNEFKFFIKEKKWAILER